MLPSKEPRADSPGCGTPEKETGDHEHSSLEEIARGLGPFAPPRDYAFEPELAGSPPRHVPSDCRAGPAGSRMRRNAITCMLMGLACIGFSRFQPVIELSFYLLPLAYLSWIGLGLVVIGAGMLATIYLPGGPMFPAFKYIKSGQAVVARVLHKRHFINHTNVHGNAVSRFGFETGVQMLNPMSGRIENAWVRSEELGNAESAKKFREPFEVGDYLTLVYLPGRFEKTSRIYCLLGVSATAPYIEKNGRTWQRGVSFPMALLLTGLVVCALGLFLSTIYALQFRSPVSDANDWSILKPLIPTAIVVGLLCAWGIHKLIRISNADPNTIVQTRIGPILTGLVGLVGGLMGAYVIVTMVNSWLDRSPPQYREFEVVNFWQTTHEGIFRTYDIEYKFLDSGKTDKYTARHDEMGPFEELRAGVAEMHRGFLGLTWIRKFYPMLVELRLDAATQPASKQNPIEFVAIVDGGKRIAASPQLTRRIMEEWRRSGASGGESKP